jgi:hypothetical protein
MNEQLVLPLQGLKPVRFSPFDSLKIVIDGVTTKFDKWLDKHPKLKAVFEVFSAGATLHVAIELIGWLIVSVMLLVATIY